MALLPSLIFNGAFASGHKGIVSMRVMSSMSYYIMIAREDGKLQIMEIKKSEWM